MRLTSLPASAAALLSLALFTTALTAASTGYADTASENPETCDQVKRIRNYFVDVYLEEQKEQGEWSEALKRMLPLLAGSTGEKSPGYLPGGKAASTKVPRLTAAEKKQMQNQVNHLRKQATAAEQTASDLQRRARALMQRWVQDPQAAEKLEKQAAAASKQAASLFDEAAILERKIYPNSLALQEAQLMNRIAWLQRAAKEADQRFLSEMFKYRENSRGWVRTPYAAAHSEILAEQARKRAADLRSEIASLEAQLAKIPGSRVGTNLRLKELAMRSFSSRSATNAAANGFKSSIVNRSFSYIAGKLKTTAVGILISLASEALNAGVGGMEAPHVLACKDLESCFDLALDKPKEFCMYAEYDSKAMDNFTDGYLAVMRATDARTRDSNTHGRAMAMIEKLTQGDAGLSDLHSAPADATRVAPPPGAAGRLQ